jgi:Low-density lipoprotein receptor domain class A
MRPCGISSGLGALLLGAAFWISIASCSSDEATTAAGSGAYCAAQERRLRECAIIGDGRYEACVNYNDAAEVCETRCLDQASCDDLQAFYCSQFDNAVIACFRACTGTEDFTCADGSTVAMFERCDTVPACSDGSDELDCESFVWTYKCRNVDQAIAQEGYCDGVRDCADGSDELPDCNPALTCLGQPVSIWNYCNGLVECSDGTDEPAGCTTGTCPLPP